MREGSGEHGHVWGTHPGSLTAFEGTEAWLARYDRGGSVLSSDYYGESCISEAYVRRHWSERFDLRAYIDADDEWLYQNLIVAQRR